MHFPSCCHALYLARSERYRAPLFNAQHWRVSALAPSGNRDSLCSWAHDQIRDTYYRQLALGIFVLRRVSLRR
jgi:hypothetical protein